MDFKHVESLAVKAKAGNLKAKEELIIEFSPYINSLCKKTYVYGYDFNDLKHECFSYLLMALSLYNTNKHTFVAYGINTIKNNLNNLIRKSIKGKALDNNFIEELKLNEIPEPDYGIIRKEEISEIKNTIKALSKENFQLYNDLIIKNIPIKQYALDNDTSYQNVYNKKKNLLKLLSINERALE